MRILPFLLLLSSCGGQHTQNTSPPNRPPEEITEPNAEQPAAEKPEDFVIPVPEQHPDKVQPILPAVPEKQNFHCDGDKCYRTNSSLEHEVVDDQGYSEQRTYHKSQRPSKGQEAAAYKNPSVGFHDGSYCDEQYCYKCDGDHCYKLIQGDCFLKEDPCAKLMDVLQRRKGALSMKTTRENTDKCNAIAFKGEPVCKALQSINHRQFSACEALFPAQQLKERCSRVRAEQCGRGEYQICELKLHKPKQCVMKLEVCEERSPNRMIAYHDDYRARTGNNCVGLQIKGKAACRLVTYLATKNCEPRPAGEDPCSEASLEECGQTGEYQSCHLE
ncbi:MAG: hypothetical protein WCK49_10005 [Myxococcaceae bacterium]